MLKFNIYFIFCTGKGQFVCGERKCNCGTDLVSIQFESKTVLTFPSVVTKILYLKHNTIILANLGSKLFICRAKTKEKYIG